MARFIAVFLCVFSHFFSAEAGDISPSNTALLGFVQSHGDPRFKINYHPSGSHIHKDSDQETVVMTDGEKRRFECILPRQSSEDLKEEFVQLNSSSVTLMADRRLTKTPDDLLALLKDESFIRHEGWWTYELYSHGKLRQMHIDNKKLVQEFDLGFYDPVATAELHRNQSNVSLQKDHRSKSAAQRYHSHLYTNGTACDLTNEPRETEVRFICSDTVNNMISSITEVSTCKYMLVFSTPLLCKHPLFQEERPRFLVIDCEEMPPLPAEAAEDEGGEMNGLLPLEAISEQ